MADRYNPKTVSNGFEKQYGSRYAKNWNMTVQASHDGQRDDGVVFRIVESDDNCTKIMVDSDDAVDLAVRILETFDPDRLAPTAFSELSKGTFLRRTIDGDIVQVVGSYDPTMHSDYPESRELDDDEVWAVRENGEGLIAYQSPTDPVWVVLEDDQIEVRTTWSFKP